LTAAYKILIHSEIREHGMGNCIALSHIWTLNCSATTEKPAEEMLNDSNAIYHQTDLPVFDEALNDHDYAYHTHLSEYVSHVVIYIAGFVVTKLITKIKCEYCSDALAGIKENLLHSFISFKDRGALTYPSTDVIALCRGIEKIIKSYLITNQTIDTQTKQIIIFQILKTFSGSAFVNLNEKHISFTDNHELLLKKAVTEQYLNVRVHHMCRSMNESEKIRTYCHAFSVTVDGVLDRQLDLLDLDTDTLSYSVYNSQPTRS
jgi:hypothetical protein